MSEKSSEKLLMLEKVKKFRKEIKKQCGVFIFADNLQITTMPYSCKECGSMNKSACGRGDETAKKRKIICRYRNF
jgi:hypothetical protein